MYEAINDNSGEHDDSEHPEWDKLPETQIVEVPQAPVKPELPPSLIDDLIENGDLSKILQLPEIRKRSDSMNAPN